MISLLLAAVVGSADHALYAFDRTTAKPRRRLYSKACGHTEWVSAVVHVAGLDVVASAGVDGKICVWRGAACDIPHPLRGPLSS